MACRHFGNGIAPFFRPSIGVGTMTARLRSGTPSRGPGSARSKPQFCCCACCINPGAGHVWEPVSRASWRESSATQSRFGVPAPGPACTWKPWFWSPHPTREAFPADTRLAHSRLRSSFVWLLCGLGVLGSWFPRSFGQPWSACRGFIWGFTGRSMWSARLAWASSRLALPFGLWKKVRLRTTTNLHRRQTDPSRGISCGVAA